MPRNVIKCVWTCEQCKKDGYFDLPARAHSATGFKNALTFHRAASPDCNYGKSVTMKSPPPKYKGYCYFVIELYAA